MLGKISTMAFVTYTPDQFQIVDLGSILLSDILLAHTCYLVTVFQTTNKMLLLVFTLEGKINWQQWSLNPLGTCFFSEFWSRIEDGGNWE